MLNVSMSLKADHLKMSLRFLAKSSDSLPGTVTPIPHLWTSDSKADFSPKQLKSKNTKWGFDIKNIKGDTMVLLARTKAKRKIENKKSSFRVHKKPVDDSKIDRYIRRNDLSEEKLLQMRSPADGNQS
jgi:hypothetical protein